MDLNTSVQSQIYGTSDIVCEFEPHMYPTIDDMSPPDTGYYITDVMHSIVIRGTFVWPAATFAQIQPLQEIISYPVDIGTYNSNVPGNVYNIRTLSNAWLQNDNWLPTIIVVKVPEVLAPSADFFAPLVWNSQAGALEARAMGGLVKLDIIRVADVQAIKAGQPYYYESFELGTYTCWCLLNPHLLNDTGTGITQEQVAAAVKSVMLGDKTIELLPSGYVMTVRDTAGEILKEYSLKDINGDDIIMKAGAIASETEL